LLDRLLGDDQTGGICPIDEQSAHYLDCEEQTLRAIRKRSPYMAKQNFQTFAIGLAISRLRVAW